MRHGVQSNFEALGESAELKTFAEMLGEPAAVFYESWWMCVVTKTLPAHDWYT